MMSNTELHPVEALLVAGLVVIEALAVLVTAVVALALALANWRPAAPQSPGSTGLPLPPPAVHPLALMADGLQALPQRQLMALAGTRSRLPKHQLAALLVATCG